MSITQTITALPPAPSRSAPSTFSSLADAFIAALEDLPVEHNTMAAQMNLVADECNANAALISSMTTYEGIYNVGTTYTKGKSISYDNRVWVSTQDANIGNTPADGSAYWTPVNLVYLVKNKTANYTVTVAELYRNRLFTNSGASGAIEFTLPTASDGYSVEFLVETAQYLKVTADGTDKFKWYDQESAAGGYVRSNTMGTSFTLTAVNSAWWITNLSGNLKYDE